MRRTPFIIAASIAVGAALGVGGTAIVLALVPVDESGVAVDVDPIVITQSPTASPTPAATTTSRPRVRVPPSRPSATPSATPTPTTTPVIPESTSVVPSSTPTDEPR